MNNPSKKTLCLTMIVKDEAKIITDMLKQVSGFINYWVIVDTGSTDGTQQVIKDFFAAQGVPGELHERPWVNFGHNRSEAMALAEGKADYLWVMDADDGLVGTPDFSNLVADAYLMKMGKDFCHWRTQLFRSGLKWSYKGVLHEYAYSDLAKTMERLPGDYYVIARCAGARAADPQKYQKDAATLEEAIKAEPDNARYWFYLGQSYFDHQNWAEAKRAYAHRVSMGGWNEEQFYAQWRVAQCSLQLKEPDDQVMAHFLKAYELRPCRAEALVGLAEFLRSKSKNALAYVFAKVASQIPFPKNDVLFMHKPVYDFSAINEYAINGYWIGSYKEAFDANVFLLTNKRVPEYAIPQVCENMRACGIKANVPPPPDELHVVRPGAIGDILMALWACEAYKRQNPKHKVFFYCHPKYLEIAKMSRAITAAIPVVYYPHFAKMLTGYPIKEGYPEKPMAKHLIEYFADELGIKKEDAWGRWELKTKKIQQGPYITIQAKTGWSPYKEWPAARWAELVARIKAKYPKYTLIQIGEKSEALIPGCEKPETSIEDAISLVAKSRLHIGGDSFPNHVRGIVNGPAVILWGSTSPIGSGYKSSTNIWHNEAYPCSPCYREYPKMSAHPKPHCPHCKDWDDINHPCLMTVSVDEVWAAVEKELG